MSRYLRWNDAIAAYFLTPEMAGRDVHLYVTSQLISQLAQNLNTVPTDFIDAVKEGPPWVTREGLCQRALQALENWRNRGLNYPPYVAYLALFVLAAGTEGDYAPYAYYPRLRALLGYPEGSMLPSFDRMYELWDDLERWSVHDRRGELGIFRARIIGNWLHVGLPIAQTLLTEQERKLLPKLFYEAGLDPTARPPAEELARALRVHGTPYLQPRTLRLLTRRDDPGLYHALLGTVAEELGEWDGEAPASNDQQPGATRQALATLRLCLQVDLTAHKAMAFLRCRLNREFPEGHLVMSGRGLPAELEAEEFVQGWSTPLRESDTGAIFEANGFDWSNGLELEDENLGWHFRLLARPVRIFVTGTPEGLPGMVESHALPKSQSFFIAFAARSRDRLDRWFSEGCRGFTEYGHIEGLPKDWLLASIAEAMTDEKIRDEFPFLSFPGGAPLRLIGGIRSSRGYNFFSFAPPDVSIESADPEVAVRCNGLLLSPYEVPGIFRLPLGLPVESRILIEVTTKDSVVARQSIYLTGDFAWQSASAVEYFDRFGLPSTNSGAPSLKLAGARVAGEKPDVSHHGQAMIVESLRLEFGRTPVLLIGRSPGQISRWPSEGFPERWQPVWAVVMARRRGRVVFCGTSLAAASPLRVPGIDRRRLNAWKEVVWYRRKRIAPPHHPTIRRLWNQYQEMAQHV